MDPEARNETTDLIEELVKSPKEFSYFQALRLLARAFRDRKRSLFDFFREKVRVRADVNLSFPGSDMTGMEKIHPDGDLASDPIFLITVTFMGLYGSASPLPPFYPRDVLEDVLDEKFGLREFFDLISYFSYRNHAYTHFRRSFPSRIIEDGDQFTLDILRSLLGIPHPSMRALTGSRRVDVPYLQLFATKLHHCPGLISYLNGRIKGADIDLEECVPRTVRIPPQQRARLGGPSSSLGDTAMLGHKALDLTGKFRIKAKAASLEELESLMPGGANRAIIEESVSRYVDSPLVYDIKINLPQGAIKGFTLGSSERALGVSTFVSPSEGSTKEIISPVKSRLRPLFQASAAASAAAGGTSR